MPAMKKYCEECGREAETKVVIKKETYDVCGELIEVDAWVLVCAECGEEFYCKEFDNATLINAYNEYRNIGLVNDMYSESGNDGFKYRELADQSNFD